MELYEAREDEELKLKTIYNHIVEHNFPQIYWVPWNKLWKREVIRDKSFKIGRIYEDKLFLYEILATNRAKKNYKNKR